MDDFISTAAAGFCLPGPHAFLTTITERERIAAVLCQCRDLMISPIDVEWGKNGLVIEFENRDDLTLFSLAYKGERSDE